MRTACFLLASVFLALVVPRAALAQTGCANLTCDQTRQDIASCQKYIASTQAQLSGCQAACGQMNDLLQKTRTRQQQCEARLKSPDCAGGNGGKGAEALNQQIQKSAKETGDLGAQIGKNAAADMNKATEGLDPDAVHSSGTKAGFSRLGRGKKTVDVDAEDSASYAVPHGIGAGREPTVNDATAPTHRHRFDRRCRFRARSGLRSPTPGSSRHLPADPARIRPALPARRERRRGDRVLHVRRLLGEGSRGRFPHVPVQGLRPGGSGCRCLRSLFPL